MQRALRLAENAIGLSQPNPRVGCVLTDEWGTFLGEGFTQQAGSHHAEVMALQHAKNMGNAERLCGAVAHVTLEPCSHTGRTPPCCLALAKAKIRKVVVAMLDPNPQVAGNGLAALRDVGIEVELLPIHHPLAVQAHELNIGFFNRMRTGNPWVRLKMAGSLDGTTALPNGKSQWITGELARQDGHFWRKRSCAVLTGLGTLQADNPSLNVRHTETHHQPHVVLVDAQFQLSTIPESLSILRNPTVGLDACRKILVYTALPDASFLSPAQKEWLEKHAHAHVQVYFLPVVNNNNHDDNIDFKNKMRVNLSAMMKHLCINHHINELHVEAGAGLNGSLLQADCVDELLLYIAPVLLGAGKKMADLSSLSEINHAQRWQMTHINKIGEDVRLLLRKTNT